MNHRTVPLDQTVLAGVFISTSRVGEVIQLLVGDEDIVQVSVEGTATSGAIGDLFVQFRFSVVCPEHSRADVARRLHDLLDNNPMFRIIVGRDHVTTNAWIAQGAPFGVGVPA